MNCTSSPPELRYAAFFTNTVTFGRALRLTVQRSYMRLHVHPQIGLRGKHVENEYGRLRRHKVQPMSPTTQFELPVFTHLKSLPTVRSY
jgi:hypothetical protein